MAQPRIKSLDFTRAIAIAAVVMIHVSSRFVSDYPVKTVEFVIGNFWDSISRIGVPLFMMTSGALMLDESRFVTVDKLFKKNIKNIALLLLFWSAFYCGVYQIIFPYLKGEPLNGQKILRAFLLGHEHLWYLYAAIGLYLATPFLRCFVKRENSKLVLLFLGISALTLFMGPVVQILAKYWKPFSYCKEFLNKFELQFFFGNTAFYLAGWYMIHVGFSDKQKKLLYLAGALCICITICYVQLTKNYDLGYSRLNLLNFVYASAVFCAINNSPKRNNRELPQKLTGFVSELSFGIYVIHILVLKIIRDLIPYGGDHPLLYLLLWYFSTFAVSMAISFIMSRIPGIKKLVRG